MATSKRKAGALGAAVIAIIGAITAIEGGYVNNPNDPGGATNHGITEKVARAHGYTGSMRDLPEEIAEDIYVDDYIVKPGYDGVIAIDPVVGEELADSGANAGPARASRWFQVALNSLNRRGADYRDVAVDGVVGSGTVAAFKALRARRGAAQSCRLMLKLLDAQQAEHYLNLASGNSRFETFMVGWVDQRIGNVRLERCGA